MRKVAIFIIVVLAVAAFASYVDLTGSVRSGVIAVSSVGKNIFFIAAQDDGKVVVYTAETIKSFETPAYIWSLGGNGIPSTGAHAHLNGVSYLFFAPKGAGLKAVYMKENSGNVKYGEASLSGADEDWSSITGGLAVVDPEASPHLLVFGLNEKGEFLVADLNIDDTGLISATVTDEATSTDERAYSTMAIGDYYANDPGNAIVYLGTDEAFYVYQVVWDLANGNITFNRLKRIPLTGKLQSGIAVGSKNVYFLTYGLNQMWFNVYNPKTEQLYSYEIPAEEGEALAGFMGNSPVVYTTEDEEDLVFFAAGKAVYYYTTENPRVDKWADVGSTIYAAPIILEDAENPGNFILVVVTADGKVYRVDFNSPAQLISDECSGLGTVYSPPIARGGALVFGISKPDGTGALCKVDIASTLNSPGAITDKGWPAFGYLDGRTQTSGYNPPFKISVFVKAYRHDMTSINQEGPYATYTINNTTPESSGVYDFSIAVMKNDDLEICAVDYFEDGYENIGNDKPFYDATDTGYFFLEWFDNSPAIENKCREVNDIDSMETLKAKYVLKYKIYHEIISDLDEKTIATETIWATALENYTMSATSNYIFVKWEVKVGNEEPTESEDPEVTFNVTAPVIVKEYVKRVYGRVDIKYPKVVIEPVPPYNKFLMNLKLSKLSTETAGPDATEIKAFYVSIDLSSLPFDANILDLDYELHTDYPNNVSAMTMVDINFSKLDDKKLEIIVSFSTPVVEATDVLLATLTIEYSGDGFPYDMDTLMNEAMVNARAGDKEISIGLIKAAFSRDDESIGYVPEFLGYTDVLGDFVNPRGCVNIWDLNELVAHYGLGPDSPGWDPRFDIAPREGFEGPATPGYLIIPGGDPANRVVDFNDILIFAMMYGYGCE